MFRDLKAQGRLLSTERMQNQANNQMMLLEDGGLYPHEAWEIMKPACSCRPRRTCRG